MDYIEKVWYNNDLKNIIYSFLIKCYDCNNNNCKNHVKGGDGNTYCFQCAYKWVYFNRSYSSIEKKFEI